MRSVELFAGAGGLAMGVSNAGFMHDAVVELNDHACKTIRANQMLGIEPLKTWPLIQADVKSLNFAEIGSDIDLLAGGPPCQPFSLGGKHGGHLDHRNLFPEAVRAVRELRPRAFMLENVKGLLRESFDEYYGYIILMLTYPTIVRRSSESWADHLSRLEKHHTSGSESDLSYRVVFRLLNAADYGVPQRRERVVIVGFRSDLHTKWSFPDPTHSANALLVDKWVTGSYWERHGVPKKMRPEIPLRLRGKVGRLTDGEEITTLPWRTVRDALADLPTPTKKGHSKHPNHELRLGARSYTGHTGSPLDEPAKTLKAGDHGVPGGENMLAYPDGRVRYFSIRESARLQTFPDQYEFPGTWTEAMRQLGNAVPVALSEAVASSIYAALAEPGDDQGAATN